MDNITLITNPSDLFYCTGYQNGDAILASEGDKRYYFTDARYLEEAERIANVEIRDIKTDLAPFIAQRKRRKFIIEESLSIGYLKHFKDAGMSNFEAVSDIINGARAIKKPFELERIKKAQNITDAVFQRVLNEICENMTERELQGLINSLIFSLGGDGLAFDTIIAFGENTSKPHAHAGTKRLKKGMIITMDFGAKFDGYCSDMTRTVAFGNVSDKIKDTYNTVLSAQNEALSHITIGKTGKQCDAYARDYFLAKDLDKYFTHGLGHSLGIDVHENPRFSPTCSDIITEGMVLSVEPGLYFPTEFGIRIEDIIYIDKTGVINLTKSPKEFIIL